MSGAQGARRAVAYIRLAEPADAPAAQARAIAAWAERERVEISAWQTDVGISGATPIAERPGLVAAYGALRDAGAGILVAASVERFAHDELVCWLIERAALTQGAALRTADGSRVPERAPARAAEADAAWTRGAVALATAYERATFRARIRASLADKRARGERVGTVPYGYRLAADRVHIEPDERELAVVSTVRALAANGLSQRAIVSQLVARGIAGRTGAPLGQTQVAKILRAGS